MARVSATPAVPVPGPDQMASVEPPAPRAPLPSPYLDFTRDDWAARRDNHPLSLTPDDIARVRGLGDRVDMREVEQVYLPLSRLLAFYVNATAGLHRVTTDFLGERPAKVPFVIGIAGSVAVGKSTTARVLRELLRRWPQTPRVDLITTDGFLRPNAEPRGARTVAAQGLPGVLRPSRAAALRRGREVGYAARARPGVLAPHLRHRPRGGDRRRPAGRPHRRGPQRPPAGDGALGPADPTGPLRLLRLLGLRRRPGRPACAPGTSSASCGCARPPSPTRSPTSTGMPR